MQKCKASSSIQPGLYNDIISCCRTNNTFDPLTTTPCYVPRVYSSFNTNQTKCERRDNRLWNADLNDTFFNTRMQVSDKDTFDIFHERQGWINLIALNMRHKTDFYTKQVGNCS